MDSTTLAHQAQAALSSLTARLSSLESQQRALLAAHSLTNSTLSSLPAYSAIAPVLSAIPANTAKLARLKRTMALQQQEVESLKRRALEAGKKRRENLRRVHERRREEQERDRTVLRARMAGESSIRSDASIREPVSGESSQRVSGSNTPTPQETPGARGESPLTMASEQGGRSTPSQGRRNTPVMVVKKKKKARKVEIQ